jgi:hypothetical protein
MQNNRQQPSLSHKLVVMKKGSNHVRQRKGSKEYVRVFCTTCRSTATYKLKWTAAST